MIRCIRLWTGPDGDSLFEEGALEIGVGLHGRASGLPIAVHELSFQETATGGSFEWHQDPQPQFVITLSGTIEFEVKSGATFTIRPGDVLIAQDDTGSGHRWRLIGTEPWRRAYVVYDPGATLHFKPAGGQA
ncbi:cupin domain-containing protein [Nitrospirillum sp. BR 11828]|uniref:cupin domain-containing protein n=1 Tax=Nitrospirillum sp. BR 11828 TaxID=3104325 RepID=UPI002ACAD3B0|nr:cupin domain-containing protein [Nitrospirillum sp. BR 11828]MDZ5645828.1 cupin domain-containing protein [Nitrospirillum sp. BR 11828]